MQRSGEIEDANAVGFKLLGETTLLVPEVYLLSSIGPLSFK